jgi:hypothetical protein
LRSDGIEMIAPHRSNRSKPAARSTIEIRTHRGRWCLSLLTMPLNSDCDCDDEHNFPLLRILR